MGEPGTKEILRLEDLEASGGIRTGRKHILSILVENKPGVLARFKISCQDGDSRAQVMQFTEIFRGKTVDVSKRSVTVEITGTDDKIEAFESMVRPFGLIELIRTGEIAVARGRSAT